jgi:membrane-bound serine protease (ClpP class)
MLGWVRSSVERGIMVEVTAQAPVKCSPLSRLSGCRNRIKSEHKHHNIYHQRKSTMEEILLDPNVVYLAAVTGVLFAFMAILTPGTGLFEIGALLALLFAAYGVYNLPNNIWALGIMLIGVVLFILALRKPQQRIYLTLSILFMMVGSLYLISGEVWWQPAVNPFLGTLISGLAGAFLWITTTKVMEARDVQPTFDLERLVGAIGETKTPLHNEGSVQVSGELWTARSEVFIERGIQVRVTGRDGFVLDVEPVEKAQDLEGET